MQIWDTAGQERYRTITKAYYKGADGILVVFDLTDKETFLSVDSWLKEIKNHCEDVNVIVLANKCDVRNPEMKQEKEEGDPQDEYYDEDEEREIEVTDEEICEFEKEHGLKVLKTSAKVGKGVDEAFLEMTKQLIKKHNNMSPEERKNRK